MVKQRTKKHKSPEVAPTPPEIPESEQWRIIQQSGVLQNDHGTAAIPSSDAVDHPDLADEIFNAILFIIPFSSLYLMMDILTQMQYGKHPSPREYAGRLASAVPVLALFIFYINRHKAKRLTQLGLFLTSLVVGSRLIWLVNRAPWHVTIRQGPPLATVWIFTITILDLLPAVVGLCLVAAWVWWSNMKLVF